MIASWLDNGFHQAAIAACIWLFIISPTFAVMAGKYIHEGMGPDGQEGGAK
jgi:hypothetical protein